MADAREDDEFSEGDGGIMHEPPIFDAVIVTIDNAELARWMALAIRCRCGSKHYPWPLLRRVTRYRRLDEIAVRLKCKKRGCRPQRVWLHWRGGSDANEVYEKTILEAPNEPVPPTMSTQCSPAELERPLKGGAKEGG